ncbi:MAG: pyridoxal-phosphate dependent enzyme [Nitrososphaerota archaeon]
MREEIICYRCGTHAEDDLEPRCSHCGGPLILSYDRMFDVSRIRTGVQSMWRYADVMPPSLSSKPITLGEGGTPITRIHDTEIYVKLDYLMPTCSFKDRGTSALMTHYLGASHGYPKGVVEDSSGNAGASVAAYSAYVGLDCVIYSLRQAAPAKLSQILAYGARVELLDVRNDELTREAERAAQRLGYLYIGHSWNPYFIEGMTTAAYEISEQLDWNPPDRIYVPTSAGTLLLGIITGFHTLLSSGILDRMPKIVAVQPSVNAPLYHAFKGTTATSPKPSIADALTHTKPPRLSQMVRELKIVGGEVTTVSEDEILRACKELALTGIYVEPSAAVGYAAIRRELDEIVSSELRVLTVATGSGLKVAKEVRAGGD